MKNCLLIFCSIFIMATGCLAANSSPETGYGAEPGGQYGGNQQQYGQYGERRNNMDMNFIYNYLAPYGRWIYLRRYGFVWTPRHMGPHWRPYRNGRWVMTEMGWTWIARERWGAIPFHYGRWGHDNRFGWFWVPGRIWGPAWVSWRWSDRYAGWAPLQPGIEIQTNMEYASISINIPDFFWTFLQTSRFQAPDTSRYALPYERYPSIIHSTSRHDNSYFRDKQMYNEGIPVDTVRRVTQRNVQQFSIRDVQQPGLPTISGKQIQIYRPAVQADAQAKPKEFMNEDAARQELKAEQVFESQQDIQARQKKQNLQAQQALRDKQEQQAEQNKKARQAQQDKQDQQAAHNEQAQQAQQNKQEQQAEQNKKARQAQQDKQDQQAEQNKQVQQAQQDKQDQQAEENKQAKEDQQDKQDQQAEENKQAKEDQQVKQDKQGAQNEEAKKAEQAKQEESKKKKKDRGKS